MRTRRKVADLGYSRMGRARKNKTHRNAAAETLAGHLSLTLSHSLSVFPVIGAHAHTHTNKYARAYVCVFVCGVRPPLFASARLHFSAAYLLHDVFIQSTSPLGSRAPRPPTIISRTKDDTSGGGGSSRLVFHECATRTCHVHAHKHDDDDLWRNPLPEANAIIKKNKIHTTCKYIYNICTHVCFIGV